MNTRHILAITAATLLSLPAVHAQAPATPATTPATPTPGAPAATAPGATGATATPAKKPLSMNEGKAVTDLLETMQFYIQVAQSGRHKDKEDKELVSFSNKLHKSMTELFTPLVSVAMENKLKNIPEAASKADKADIAKLGKPKAEKWKQDYFELVAKNAKRDVRQLDNAIKSMQDAQVKDVATKTQAAIQTAGTEAEAKFKELKDKK